MVLLVQNLDVRQENIDFGSDGSYLDKSTNGLHLEWKLGRKIAARAEDIAAIFAVNLHFPHFVSLPLVVVLLYFYSPYFLYSLATAYVLVPMLNSIVLLSNCDVSDWKQWRCYRMVGERTSFVVQFILQ